MKTVRYATPEGPRSGVVIDGVVFETGPDLAAAEPGKAVGELGDAPCSAPSTCRARSCLGLNYRDHAQEAGQELPERPLLFGKFAITVIGPGAAIRIPEVTTQGLRG